jgi:SAM-dependent methyltransferase
VSDREREVAAALLEVRSLYSTSLSRYGLDPRSVGWHDDAAQKLRFDKLAYLIDRDAPSTTFTVNDWGCGYGAMFCYLDRWYGDRLAAYTGYDISPEMLAAANSHVADPKATFVEADDVLARADYSFASGTFNVRRGAPEGPWNLYVRRMLRRLAAQSARGFAFNLMTSYVDWRVDDLFYADPADYFTFCRSELSRGVTLMHDYPLYEWTMIVFTAPPGRHPGPGPS